MLLTKYLKYLFYYINKLQIIHYICFNKYLIENNFVNIVKLFIANLINSGLHFTKNWKTSKLCTTYTQ
jgi:hypothetical protein